MGTKYNTQIANGSYVEEGTVSQTEWQNRNEQIMSYVKVSFSFVNSAYKKLEIFQLRSTLSNMNENYPTFNFTLVKLELRKIQKMTGNQLKKHLDQQLLNELNPEIKLIIMINYLTTRVLTPFDRARVIFRNSSIIELGKPS